MPIDLPHLVGQIPHDAERAVQILRESLEVALGRIATLEARPIGASEADVQRAIETASPVSAAAGALVPGTAPTNPVPPGTNPPGTTQADGWAATAPDGTEVLASTTGTPTVTFGGGAPITLPAYGQYLDAVDGWAIVKGADGNAYLIEQATGMVTDLGPAYGTYSVGLMAGGVPVIQDSATTFTVGGVSNPIPAPVQGTTFGFLEVDGGGNPQWLFYQIAGGIPVVINDVTFAYASTDGDWTIGISTIFPTQYLAYRASTNEMFFAGSTANSSALPRLTISGGHAFLSRSLPAGFIGDAFFTPYDPTTPPADPPSIPPVIVPPTNPPAGGAVDQIDANTAIFENNPVGIAGWTKTTRITQLDVSSRGSIPTFDKQDGATRWPDVRPPGWDGDLQYTIGLCYRIGGQWYCSAPIQIWYNAPPDPFGGPPSLYTTNWFYDPVRWPVMSTHVPIVGEQLGFFVVEGNVRNETGATSDQYPLQERSNIVLFNMPPDSGAIFNY